MGKKAENVKGDRKLKWRRGGEYERGLEDEGESLEKKKKMKNIYPL